MSGFPSSDFNTAQQLMEITYSSFQKSGNTVVSNVSFVWDMAQKETTPIKPVNHFKKLNADI